MKTEMMKSDRRKYEKFPPYYQVCGLGFRVLRFRVQFR